APPKEARTPVETLSAEARADARFAQPLYRAVRVRRDRSTAHPRTRPIPAAEPRPAQAGRQWRPALTCDVPWDQTSAVGSDRLADPSTRRRVRRSRTRFLRSAVERLQVY